MGNRYLVVSDLHLCDVQDNPDGWMAYKSSRYLFDDAFAELLAKFTAKARANDRLTLVLNGDIFDFDLIVAVPADPPWPVSGSERQRGLRSTAQKSAWKLDLILSHHPAWVKTLAKFLSLGHRVVYVMGNHDRELYFEAVRAALVGRLHEAARDHGADFDNGQVQFEPWFYYHAGEIYAEHGQQYDYYTTFRNPLCPVVDGREGPMLALPMGNLSNRFLITRMGFFNPFATDYIRNAFSYLTHWMKYYAFSRRSLVLVWFWGSIVVMGKLLATKKRQLKQPKECPEILQDISSRHQITPAALAALERLQRPPITNRFFRIAREFWLDRLVLFTLMVGGTITLALVPIPLWIKFMVPLAVFPLILFIYESFMHGETVFSIEREVPNVARAVASILPAAVVTFGHDHVPRLLPINRKTTFVDTGTWAPIFNEQGEHLPGYRNYLAAVFDDEGLAEIQFGAWINPPA